MRVARSDSPRTDEQREPNQGRLGLPRSCRESSLRRHRYAVVSGKLPRMMTAIQAFGGCHQEPIAYLLIGRNMSCQSPLSLSTGSALTALCATLRLVGVPREDQCPQIRRSGKSRQRPDVGPLGWSGRSTAGWGTGSRLGSADVVRATGVPGPADAPISWVGRCHSRDTRCA